MTFVPDEKRGSRLVVLYENYTGNIQELLDKVREGLPPLWIPSQNSFLKVDRVPMLGTGKADLKAIKNLGLELTQPK